MPSVWIDGPSACTNQSETNAEPIPAETRIARLTVIGSRAFSDLITTGRWVVMYIHSQTP